MSQRAQKLSKAIKVTKLLDPVEVTAKGNSVSILCRPIDEKSWIANMAILLENEYNVHLCKKYVLKDDGSLAYGWYISVSGKNAAELDEAIDHLVALIYVFKAPEVPKPPKMTKAQAKTKVKEQPVKSQANGPQVVFSGKTEKGEDIIVTEMKLPHVPNGDMNAVKSVFDPSTGRYKQSKGATFAR